MSRPRIAVVTPFLDKRHGTERCVVELIRRLDTEFDFWIYSARVEDVDPGRVVWRRIPELPGPQLAKYIFWFLANRLRRWWDERFSARRPDLVYSPGVNCLDAQVVTVHVVFAEYLRLVAGELRLRRHPLRAWPRLLHRRIYYRLIAALERRVYSNSRTLLGANSRKTVEDVFRHYGKRDGVTVVYHGLELDRFHPDVCARLRAGVRAELGMAEGEIALLLVGNDWRNKGLPCLLAAAAALGDERIRVLVVGTDDPAVCAAELDRFGLRARVQFLPPRRDVEAWYAAADIYVGPSLEDAFALPPAEAMACGLPVVVSSRAGVSEVVTEGLDGFVLRDPADVKELTVILRRLVSDAELRRRIGEQAAQAAQQYTWERNAAIMRSLFRQALGEPAAELAVEQPLK
jgi:glycosyltransferase involved in cell wall biosynthesis